MALIWFLLPKYCCHLWVIWICDQMECQEKRSFSLKFESTHNFYGWLATSPRILKPRVTHGSVWWIPFGTVFTICPHYKHTTDFHPSSHWLVLQEKGEWNGLVRALMDEKADMSLASLSITPERNQMIDFSVPFLETGITIIVAVRDGVISPTAFLGERVFSLYHYLQALAKGKIVPMHICGQQQYPDRERRRWPVLDHFWPLESLSAYHTHQVMQCASIW